MIAAPLQLPRMEAPTAADVDAWHARYVEALVALFERHKAAHGAAGATLEVY